MSLLLEISESQVVELLAQMPQEQRNRILARFATSTETPVVDGESTPKKTRRAGTGKEHIAYIAADFDAPLEDCCHLSH